MGSGQPTTDTDPDSLRLTPTGDLMLTSEADGQLIFVAQPGTPKQSVSFLQLIDPSTGLAINSGIDDALFATAGRGVFYLQIEVDHVPLGTLFVSVSDLNELATVGIHTGLAKPFVANLNAPHGLRFVPADDEDEQ